MSAGFRARAHSREFELDHFGAEQRHDPADRPDEPRPALSGPIYGLRKVNFQDDLRQRFRQDLPHRTTCSLFGVAVILALRSRLQRERFHLNALFFREARDGGFRRRLRRPHHQLFGIGLPLDKRVGLQHQPPRRSIHAHRGSRKSGLGERLLKQRAQILERARNHPVRNLFSADFEKKRKAHWGRFSFLSISSTRSIRSKSRSGDSSSARRLVVLSTNFSRPPIRWPNSKLRSIELSLTSRRCSIAPRASSRSFLVKGLSLLFMPPSPPAVAPPTPAPRPPPIFSRARSPPPAPSR